ncbi:MAG: hypothetical protein CBB87_09535 [Micavibrio sp. TMED27]|nr:hypothetical protein [Micavibrio sp.]OUT90379.1 MAG: hypothetical protein CBB87_09535 [Micavibrio sp. TMED27]|tara:strand:- start:1180 stop:1536 length:357 start_codon:yes stop_codon:yes gene_type:complete
MAVGDFFTFLYPIVPLIAMSGFVPQFIAAFRCTKGVPGVSLMTWNIWLASWMISLGYAVFALNDLMFSLTCLMNVILNVAFISMVMTKRQRFFIAIKNDTQTSGVHADATYQMNNLKI